MQNSPFNPHGGGLTFDQWAEHIGTRVSNAFPQCRLRRKIDDVYRWAYGAKECQLHAVNDSQATFVALLRESLWPKVAHAPDCVAIDEHTELEIAERIIRWFGC